MERLSPERLAAAEKRKVPTGPLPDLADPATLEALLNMVVLDATKILTGPELGRAAMLDAVAREAARMLLGYEPGVVAKPGWHCPGGIDVHCNNRLGLNTEGPMTRVRMALDKMIEELGIPAGHVGRTGKLPPGWQENCDRAVQRYASLFSGGPLGA